MRTNEGNPGLNENKRGKTKTNCGKGSVDENLRGKCSKMKTEGRKKFVNEN
jgi:hypothetical protein